MKKNNKEKTEEKGNAAHFFKLMERAELEIRRLFLNHQEREAVKGFFNDVVLKSLEEMEKKDMDYQNLPEVRAKNMQEELERNDRVLESNGKNLRNQVQEGLYQKGLPVGSAWYDSLIEKMNLDLEQKKLELETSFSTINPTFIFQEDKRWKEIQIKNYEKNIAAIQGSLKELEGNVESVKQQIQEQNERIIARRAQIIEELEKIGHDVSQYKTKPQDYIG